jgi:putative transposase
MRKTVQYRLDPTKQQQRLLDQHLAECRWRYNHLLAERRAAWEQRQEALRYYEQAMSLPGLKAERLTLGRVHAQVVQTVAVRSELAFKAFLRRTKTGAAPGYPRFRGTGRYVSITSPQAPVGCKVEMDAKHLRLYGVGQVTSSLHRPLEGAPTTATSSRSRTGKWYGQVVRVLLLRVRRAHATARYTSTGRY